MAMPAVVQLTLWYGAGCSLAAGFALYPALTLGLCLAAGLVGFTIDAHARAGTLALPYGLALAAFGFAQAQLAIGQRRADCRTLLTDERWNDVVAVLLQAPVRNSAAARLESVNGKPCDRQVRLLLGRGPIVLDAGARVRLEAEWWPDRQGSALDAHAGALAARTVQRLEGVDRVAALRGRAVSDIQSLFGEQAPLAEALLVAQRDGIDPRVKRDFAASGLAHLLAISGTHVALVAGAIMLLAALARLPVVVGGAIGAAAAIAYVAFLGAPYPAVRAALQIVLVLASRWLQRPAHPFALLASAAFSILLWDPLALLDAGFQLSVGGLAGIIAWRKPLIELQPASLPVVLRDAVATTAAASLATTPIAAFHFGQVSLIALVANLMALPVVSAAVPASAAALLLKPVAALPASFVADGARLLLGRLQDVATVTAAVPGGHFYVTRASVVAGACVLVAAHTILAHWVDRLWLRRLAAAAVAAATLPLVSAAWSQADRGALELHAIDVGQGDALAIRTPRGRWILIDAGPASDRYDAGHARVAPFLLRHGVEQIDLLVITHPHLDHFGGAPAVMRVIRTHAVLAADSGRTAQGALAAVQASRYQRWLTARPGLRLVIDSVSLRVLHPDAGSLGTDDANDASIVLQLAYGQFDALFSGDAPAWVEQRILDQGSGVDVEVIKAGHHGSSTSTGQAWLNAATPLFAIVSAGRGNKYGHPAPVVLERLQRAGVTVLRTDRQGTVSLRAWPDGRVERQR